MGFFPAYAPGLCWYLSSSLSSSTLIRGSTRWQRRAQNTPFSYHNTSDHKRFADGFTSSTKALPLKCARHHQEQKITPESFHHNFTPPYLQSSNVFTKLYPFLRATPQNQLNIWAYAAELDAPGTLDFRWLWSFHSHWVSSNPNRHSTAYSCFIRAAASEKAYITRVALMRISVGPRQLSLRT